MKEKRMERKKINTDKELTRLHKLEFYILKEDKNQKALELTENEKWSQ